MPADQPTGQPAAIVDEAYEVSVEELCRNCDCSIDTVVLLVREGVIEPQGDAPDEWRFHGTTLQRARVAWHLMRDLEINAPGVALALDLLEEIAQLKSLLRRGP